jgi:hypothetical protein
MPPWRCETLARPAPLYEAVARWLGRSPRIGGHAARGLSRAADGIRVYHPAARMLSMRAATSSISRRSSSSASSAATSAARTAPRRSRAALSRIARRIASDLLRPVASSCASARRASGSRRTLMADVTQRAYHDPSYKPRDSGLMCAEHVAWNCCELGGYQASFRWSARAVSKDSGLPEFLHAGGRLG